MKKVFIIQKSSGTSKRVLKRIGDQKDKNTLGFLVESYEYSQKLRDWKKPKIKKFEFFGQALAFTNYESLKAVK